MNELFRDFPDVLTVRQMQDALQIGRTTAYKLLEDGEIRCFKIGRSYKIPKSALVSFVQKLSG